MHYDQMEVQLGVNELILEQLSDISERVRVTFSQFSQQ